MPINALTGTRIRERRSLMGLRQADLARAAGVSPSYLNLIEHNRRNIAGALLKRIAEALEVTPAALTGGMEPAVSEALREAAAEQPDTGAETDRIEELAGRFPGWTALIAAQQDRLRALERAVETLSDRMSHDPHLSASLHELLSAAASVRSTAAILADTPDLEPDWRALFQKNLAEDSARLAAGAEALAGFLDSVAAEETGIAAPQEELESWLEGIGWHIPELEDGGSADQVLATATPLASGAAQRLARDWLARYAADAAAMPLPAVLDALERDGVDPGRIAARLGADPAAVFRRLAVLPEEAGRIGLVICDGSGTLVFRKPLQGFALPRFGAACPLWPLYQALSRPGLAVRATIEVAGRRAACFAAWAWCESTYPEGFGGTAVLRSYMLIKPDAGGPDPVQPVGTSCRICPRSGCPARREPAIVAETA
ncbi:MAG: helix-turn-helix domain-containing protein [Gemmobacter sp.]